MTDAEIAAALGCAGNFAGGPCERPPVEIVHIGCVHEHVASDPACARCAEFVRRYIATGELICIKCDESAEPHRCPAAEAAPATVLASARPADG